MSSSSRYFVPTASKETAIEELTVAQIAKKLCCSVRTLQTSYRAVFGTTVWEDMAEARLEKAKKLIEQYNLPFVAYNQGSIVHLECSGAMSFDFSSMNLLGSVIPMLKKKPEMLRRKVAMEEMGAAYMAHGIVTLAGSRLYTSLADTDEVIDEALNRFDDVFKNVEVCKRNLDK